MIAPSLRDKFYEEAACNGINPGFFDGTNPNDIYTKAGLNVCETCTVQLECVIVVKPRESFFDGICGGKVWSNGQIVGDKNGISIDVWNGIDEVAVDLLISGELHWKRVPLKERKFAAVKMRKQGKPVHVIMDKTRMSGSMLNKLFESEGIN